MSNPWRHLGALAFLFLVACMASGTYLWALFDTSVRGAYESGRALTDDPWLLGRLMRGLHRYSGDACVLATVVHIVREAARGHFRAWRAWSWVSGWVLVPLLWVAGVTGFWLAWDERAFFSVAATGEWLAAWPWRIAAFARNFATGEAMNDRFFSLASFVHIGVPLFALAAMWAHVARIARVRAWPPRGLGAGALGVLAVLALAYPAVSLGRADALSAAPLLSIDWFFLFPHALMDVLGPEGLWLAAGACAAVACAMPWLGRTPRVATARVDLAHCNGCARCADDCPFGAIDMVARTDGRPHAREPAVEAAWCAGCGICVGACPSSTPLRRARPLASGIELPGLAVDALRSALDGALEVPGAIVVFGCAAQGGGGRGTTGRIAVPCVAMVPPAFVEYALRRGASGVVLAGCREDDCEFRLGERWVRERFAGRRPPRLRASVASARVRIAWVGGDDAALQRAIESLRTGSPEMKHA